MNIMQGHYDLNIARREKDRPAWDSKPHAPKYLAIHYARVILDTTEARAREIAQDFAKRFPEGDKPGDFHLSLTYWEGRGSEVKFRPDEPPVVEDKGYPQGAGLS